MDEQKDKAYETCEHIVGPDYSYWVDISEINRLFRADGRCFMTIVGRTVELPPEAYKKILALKLKQKPMAPVRIVKKKEHRKKEEE